MRLVLLAYSLGVMLDSFTDGSLRAVVIPGLLACSLICALLLRDRMKSTHTHSTLADCLWIGTGLCVGLTWHTPWAFNGLSGALPGDLEGRNLPVSGEIISLPQQGRRAQRFQFYIHSCDCEFERRRILLNYYGDASLQVGQRWHFTVRLNKPRGYANPGTFDYEAWLFQQRIAARGYVRLNAPALLTGHSTQSIAWWRFSAKQKLLQIGSGLDSNAIVLALTLGDRTELDASRWELFNQTGTSHLFVISGLHIGMVAGLCFWLVSALLWLSPGVSGRLPRQKLAACAALLYALLAGFTLPTQRAFIMIVIFMSAYLSQRPSPVSLRFIVALSCILTLNPLAAMTAGFWFSFVAVGVLLCCVTSNPPIRDFEVNSQHSVRLLQRFVKPQLIIFLGLLVPLIFWTQQVSLMAPLINMLAIPLVGFVVVPLCLLALLLAYPLPQVVTLLLQWVDHILNLLFGIMEQLVAAGGQWALLQLTSLNTPTLLAAILGVLLLLLPVSRTYRYLALPLLLSVFLPAKSPVDAPSLWQHVLDVDQGLAVILQTPNHALVYDTGAGEDAESNLGRSVVVPVLKHLDIESLDALIVSHGDTDHAGGIPGIMAALPVGRRYGSESVTDFQQGAEFCVAGQSWT